MSFSFSLRGTPSEIKQKLAIDGLALSGQSKQEFAAVRLALDIILDQNVGGGPVCLRAWGHATFKDGEKSYGDCGVEIKRV